MRAHRLTPAVLATLGLLGGGLVFSSAPALAAKEYVLSGAFGMAGSGNGEFTEPSGIAVNQSSGDVYVVDKGNNRVEWFNSTGSNFEGQFNGSGLLANEKGKSAPVALSEPEGIAVDNSGKTKLEDPSVGDVYVINNSQGVIDKFSSTGEYLSQLKETTAGALFVELHGVAVDSAGNVWVYQAGDVDEFSDTGSFVKGFETGRGTRPGVAVDPNDDLYLNCCGGAVVKFSSAGEELIEFSNGETTALAIDPATNNLLVDKESRIDEYATSEERFSAPVQEFGAPGLSGSHGIAVSDAGTGKAYATESAADEVVVFDAVTLPEVITGGSSNEGRTTATVEGSVNPEGTKTTYYFQYGATEAYGSSTAPASAGEGNAQVPVSANLTGLKILTSYHYRLVAENENGIPNYGIDKVVKTTIPAVEGVQAEAASDVGPTSATLNGSLEPNGFETHYYFGINGIRTTEEGAGQATEVKQVSASVGGLEPNTTYPFRLIAENSFGATTSSTEQFTTAAIPPVVTVAATITARTTAVLAGAVNPENSPTSYHFVYGPTSSYGQSTPKTEIGSNFGEDPTAPRLISELQPGTTYHYRLVATNQAGTEEGPDETFTTSPPTPPVAITAGASGVSQNTATISGTVSTNGLQTKYGFEIGTEAGNYGPATGLGSLGGVTTEAVSVTLSQLQPGTTYQYRIVATNADGTSYGEPQAFATPGFPILLRPPSAPPLIATPAIAFPTETGTTTKTTTKALTRAQKLAAALKACRTESKGKRARCEKRARKQYAPAAKKKNKKT
jgi:hypothetical protein